MLASKPDSRVWSPKPSCGRKELKGVLIPLHVQWHTGALLNTISKIYFKRKLKMVQLGLLVLSYFFLTFVLPYLTSWDYSWKLWEHSGRILKRMWWSSDMNHFICCVVTRLKCKVGVGIEQTRSTLFLVRGLFSWHIRIEEELPLSLIALFYFNIFFTISLVNSSVIRFLFFSGGLAGNRTSSFPNQGPSV